MGSRGLKAAVKPQQHPASAEVPSRQAPSVERSGTPSRSMVTLLRVLDELAAVDHAGVTALSRQMAIPPATAYRMLKVLEHCGYVEQVPASRQYRLTLKLFEIGSRVAGRLTIRNAAAVEMERLARQSGLAVNLGVLLGRDLLYLLEKVQTDDTVVLNLPPGTRVPAHCTAMGKALLAYSSDDPRAILGDGPYERKTEHSLGTYEELVDDLAVVRRVGYAIDRQEFSHGIWCVAAPVIDDRGHALGAISVSALRATVAQSELDDWGVHVVAAARVIASRIHGFSSG